jgi:hypothetical protein
MLQFHKQPLFNGWCRLFTSVPLVCFSLFWWIPMGYWNRRSIVNVVYGCYLLKELLLTNLSCITYIPLTLYPRRVAEVSQKLLQNTHVLPKLVSYEKHCRRDGGKRIAVLLHISGVSAINHLVAFTTSMEEREICYSFILSKTPHETFLLWMS